VNVVLVSLCVLDRGVLNVSRTSLGQNQIVDNVQFFRHHVFMNREVSDADDVQLLRQHGVQVTAQRLAILREVSNNPHVTADELCDNVRETIGSISRQAVYDTLGVLVDKNLLRRIQPSGSAARYEDRVGDNHHHVICRVCAVMFDVDCAVGEVPCLTAAVDHDFEIDEAEVVYWGRCPNCRTLTANSVGHADTAGSTPTQHVPKGKR
jgi:Fur family transcriptional regulator, stress-responsive regulator